MEIEKELKKKIEKRRKEEEKGRKVLLSRHEPHLLSRGSPFVKRPRGRRRTPMESKNGTKEWKKVT